MTRTRLSLAVVAMAASAIAGADVVAAAEDLPAGGPRVDQAVCDDLDDAVSAAVISGSPVGDLLVVGQMVHRTNGCGEMPKACDLLLDGMRHAVVEKVGQLDQQPTVHDVAGWIEGFGCRTEGLIPIMQEGLRARGG